MRCKESESPKIIDAEDSEEVVQIRGCLRQLMRVGVHFTYTSLKTTLFVQCIILWRVSLSVKHLYERCDVFDYA